MRVAKPPVQFRGQEFGPDQFPERHAAFMGDHNREILSELGCDESMIARTEEREANNKKLMQAAVAAQEAAAKEAPIDQPPQDEA